MKLNKYSQSKNGTVIGSYTDRLSSGSSSSTSSGASSLDREIWGQPDTGGDIDGNMAVNGNVFIGEVTYDDEDKAEVTHEFPSESGNLYVEKSVESPVIKAGQSLMVPDSGGGYMDILQLISNLQVQVNAATIRLNAISQKLNEIEDRLSSLS